MPTIGNGCPTAVGTDAYAIVEKTLWAARRKRSRHKGGLYRLSQDAALNREGYSIRLTDSVLHDDFIANDLWLAPGPGALRSNAGIKGMQPTAGPKVQGESIDLADHLQHPVRRHATQILVNHSA